MDDRKVAYGGNCRNIECETYPTYAFSDIRIPKIRSVVNSTPHGTRCLTIHGTSKSDGERKSCMSMTVWPFLVTIPFPCGNTLH